MIEFVLENRYRFTVRGHSVASVVVERGHEAGCWRRVIVADEVKAYFVSTNIRARRQNGLTFSDRDYHKWYAYYDQLETAPLEPD